MRKIYLKNIILFASLLLINIATIDAQCITDAEFSKTNPKGDLRGVFLPSVFNLNWRTNRFATPAVQQAELIAILDNLKTSTHQDL